MPAAGDDGEGEEGGRRGKAVRKRGTGHRKSCPVTSHLDKFKAEVWATIARVRFGKAPVTG